MYKTIEKIKRVIRYWKYKLEERKFNKSLCSKCEYLGECLSDYNITGRRPTKQCKDKDNLDSYGGM